MSHRDRSAIPPPGISCNRVQTYQDGRVRSPKDLESMALGLGQALDTLRPARVALASGRADQVMAALAACQARDCELLLTRERYPDDSPLWRDWQVSAVVDETFVPVPLAGSPAPTRGFRILLATSGTTGQPKVAKHTPDRLLGRIRAPKASANLSRWLLTYHPASFAGMQVLLTAMAAGAELIACSTPTVPALAEAALALRPTHISGTPTFWRGFLLALGARAAEIPLVQATLGGETVDQATLDRLRAAFPQVATTQIYASTEAGALFAVRDGRAGFPAAWLEEGVDGVGLRQRDGLLEVWSPRAMEGYVAGTAASPMGEDGWLRTGDAVERVGDRVLFRGRADTTINVGGAKVSPEEVEAVLLEIPVVADARVYGVKSPITGQLVAADLVLQAGAAPDPARQEILVHLRARFPEYKVPRIIRFTDRLETSSTGKKKRV